MRQVESSKNAVIVGTAFLPSHLTSGPAPKVIDALSALAFLRASAKRYPPSYRFSGGMFS
jgi:hypothetical protein